jgi:four helix bundle protein
LSIAKRLRAPGSGLRAPGSGLRAPGSGLRAPGFDLAIGVAKVSMSRDHRKLRAFQIADSLVMDIYRETKDFPRDEWYGLRSQIRRAAISSSSNLVEGSATRSTKEYLKFCNIACGSAFETRYLIGLACRLGFLSKLALNALKPHLDTLCASLVKLVAALELQAAAERKRSRAAPR